MANIVNYDDISLFIIIKASHSQFVLCNATEFGSKEVKKLHHSVSYIHSVLCHETL